MSQIQFSFSLLRSRFILITLGPTITAITSRETRAGAFLNGTVQQKKRIVALCRVQPFAIQRLDCFLGRLVAER